MRFWQPMPTHRSLLAAGMTEDEIAIESGNKHQCYVCEKPVVGLAQKDEPRRQATQIDGVTVPPAPPDLKLGVRHRDCKPSEHAESTKKVMLAWRPTQLLED